MDLLRKLYLNPSNPGSFGGYKRLLREAKKQSDVSGIDVERFLRDENTYTLHRDRRIRFPRNKIITSFKDELWQSDLVDMSRHARLNNGVRYLVVTIDVFTKYLFVEPAKTKKPEAILAAFKSILRKSGRVPCSMQTDRGKELDNKVMHTFYNDNQIVYYTSKNSTFKCAVVERVNRTLKSRMYRYFTFIGKHKYLDKLQDFVSSYNNSYHRIIKMTPHEAMNTSHKVIFNNTFGKTSLDSLYTRTSKNTIPLGSTTRVAYDKHAFDKGYESTFTDTTGEVVQKIGQKIPLYALKDYTGRVVPRRFYREELQPIPPPKYRVEKVIKTRDINGKRQYYVKWLNYPSTENSWVDLIEDV